jgi:site-specific recombinase XerD
MSSLRAQYVRELTIRGRADTTIHAYVANVAALAKHYHRPPDQISDEEIRAWLEHLRRERGLSGSSLNAAVHAVRAFQEWVLLRPRAQCVRGIPRCRRETRRAEV